MPSSCVSAYGIFTRFFHVFTYADNTWTQFARETFIEGSHNQHSRRSLSTFLTVC